MYIPGVFVIYGSVEFAITLAYVFRMEVSLPFLVPKSEVND